MTKKSRQILFGALALVIGLVVFSFNLSLFGATFEKLWPAIPLVVGILLFMFYFATRRKKDRALLLFGATFLVLLSVPFFVMAFTPPEANMYIWPAFLLALGLSLLAVHYYGRPRRPTLVAGTLIVAASLVIWLVYVTRTRFGLLFSVALIITGALVLIRGLTRDQPIEPEPVSEPVVDEKSKT
jgi:uncharacterized membrane protein HdeD (DUF308 family)